MCILANNSAKIHIDKASGVWVTSVQDHTFKYWKDLPGIL